MHAAHDVVTIGTAVQDMIFPLAAGAGAVVPGAKLEAEAPFFSSGGGALNAAVSFARLGFSPLAVFCVGDDEAGEKIMRDMKSAGIACAARKVAGAQTGHSVILLRENGERTAIAYRGASEHLTLHDVPFAEMHPKWAYIAPSNIAPSVIHKIVERFYFKGVSIAINPSRPYLERHGEALKPILSQTKVLMVNRDEASILTGVARTHERELFKKLDAMIAGIAVMTDGPKGAWASDGKRLYKAGIFPNKKVTDRTGAGDAFGSAFVAGMMLYGDIAHALRLATANATSAVETIGAQTGLISKSAFERDARWHKLDIGMTEIG